MNMVRRRLGTAAGATVGRRASHAGNPLRARVDRASIGRHAAGASVRCTAVAARGQAAVVRAVRSNRSAAMVASLRARPSSQSSQPLRQRF